MSNTPRAHRGWRSWHGHRRRRGRARRRRRGGCRRRGGARLDARSASPAAQHIPFFSLLVKPENQAASPGAEEGLLQGGSIMLKHSICWLIITGGGEGAHWRSWRRACRPCAASSACARAPARARTRRQPRPPRPRLRCTSCIWSSQESGPHAQGQCVGNKKVKRHITTV